MILLAAVYAAWAYALWLLFLVAMMVKRKHQDGTLPRSALVLAAPAIAAALLVDVGFNVIASLPFLELPKEWTFSQRLGRYIRGIDWRTPIARFICKNLLDPFDTGGHCNHQ